MKAQRTLPWYERLGLLVYAQESSLDAPVGDEGQTWDEHLPIDTLDPGAAFALDEKAAIVRGAVENLPERLRRVIELRFGFVDGDPKGLAEIGLVFGLSRERIRQLEAEAFGVLRKHSELRRLAA